MTKRPNKLLRVLILFVISTVVAVTLGLFGLSLWAFLGALVLSSPGFRSWVMQQRGYTENTRDLPLWDDRTPKRLFLSLSLYLLPLGLGGAVFLLGIIRSGGVYLLSAAVGLVGLVYLHLRFVYGDGRLEIGALSRSLVDSLHFAGERKGVVIPAALLGLGLPALCGMLTMAIYLPASAGQTLAQQAPPAATVVEGSADDKYGERVTVERPTKAVETVAAEQPTYTPLPSSTYTPVPTVTPVPVTQTRRPTRTPVPPLVSVNVASANLRSGPGTLYGVINSSLQGEEFEVLGKTADGSWFNVQDGSGLSAWIAASVVNEVYRGGLDRVEVAATVPAPPPPTDPPVPTATTVPPTFTAVPPTLLPPTEAPTTAARAPEPVPAQECTPGYSPCIPPGPDVDCAGGSGNGPRYVQGPIMVTGSDPYDLDRDGDGIGCE